VATCTRLDAVPGFAMRRGCDEHNTVDTASLIENWIDETEAADMVLVSDKTRIAKSHGVLVYQECKR
jgi:hypothetical protein